jgi:flagellar biosynthetic protein FlhB
VAGEKTEKATPKKRDEARQKGQVARSQDLNGAVMLMATLLLLPTVGPMVWEQTATATRRALGLLASPDVVSREGLWTLAERVAVPAGMAVLPIAFACALAAVASNVVQVGFKPRSRRPQAGLQAAQPRERLQEPLRPRAAFETGKSVLKVAVVGAITAAALLPKLDELGALVGMPPVALVPALAKAVLEVVQWSAAAYLVIALADYGYQRWRHEKDLRMGPAGGQDEYKQQSVPNEVRAALRQRQRAAAGKRMMDAVPTADVVVTNPTHYAVALRYEPAKTAPEVVAKGMDAVAARIREAAGAAGVPDRPRPAAPPRSLHASVEVGDVIPEELYQAVAQLLAFVYRTARRAV